jgi:proteasome lid subunit RPN8/RPN11
MTTDAETTASKPDIDEILTREWPTRELLNFTGRRESHFQVVFNQSVLDQIHLHGQSSAEIEVCGVLVGDVFQDSKGPYLLIDQCVRGNNASSQTTNVTFTAETWQHIQETMDREHPDRKILGWYHTHPGFGIFLSDMDTFICDHFFNLPWQVAFVYDPVSGEEGNFVWRHGKPAREPVLVATDVTPAAANIPLITKTQAMATEAPLPESPVKFRDKNSELIGELVYRVTTLERRLHRMTIAIVFLAAFVAFWAVGLVPGSQNQMPQTPPRPATQPVYRPMGVYP